MKPTARWIWGAGGLAALGALLIFWILSQNSSNLPGTRWNLAFLNGHAPLGASGTVSISFEAGQQVSGNSGCNIFGGSYSTNGSRLALTQLNSTMRACADQGLNDQEAEFYQALGVVTAYEISGGQLLLRDAGGTAVLTFNPG